MGVRIAIPIDEYLRTSFPDLDREYRDGEVVERTMPTLGHSRTQQCFCVWFGRIEESHPLFAAPELRLRVGPLRVLIPDVCVFAGVKPTEDVPSTPPLIAIEILSPDDRMSEVREKLDEYRRWGVTHVWLADPRSRRFYVCDNSFREVTSFLIPEFGLEIKPADIFRSK